MYSILRPTLLYTDISTDIAENDEDHDASEWAYSDKTVYRGALDISYKNQGLDVFWLYNEELTRVGLAEHESGNHAVFETLWFRESPFGTLFQEDWKTGETVFSMMSSEAYQDCVDSDILLKGVNRLVLPRYLTEGFPSIYECACGTSFSPMCSAVKKTVKITNPIFIDESFVVYYPPEDSRVFKLEQLRDACGQEQRHPSAQQEPQEGQQLQEPLAETREEPHLQEHRPRQLPQRH